MTAHDPFELLCRIDPIGTERFTAADEARLDDIIDDILEGRLAGDAPPPRRTRQLVAAALLVTAVAGTAAWAILRTEPATDPLAVECHRTVSLDGDVVLAEAVDGAVTDCAAPWRDGTFGEGEPPELTACVRDSGTAAVFPAGPEVCERLGLAPIDAPVVGADAVSELQSSLRLAFGAVCVTRDEAVSIVERSFTDLDLAGWTIQFTAPFSEERPCAGVGVFPRERLVVLGGRLPQVPAPPASVSP